MNLRDFYSVALKIVGICLFILFVFELFDIIQFMMFRHIQNYSITLNGNIIYHSIKAFITFLMASCLVFKSDTIVDKTYKKSGGSLSFHVDKQGMLEVGIALIGIVLLGINLPQFVFLIINYTGFNSILYSAFILLLSMVLIIESGTISRLIMRRNK